MFCQRLSSLLLRWTTGNSSSNKNANFVKCYSKIVCDSANPRQQIRNFSTKYSLVRTRDINGGVGVFKKPPGNDVTVGLLGVNVRLIRTSVIRPAIPPVFVLIFGRVAKLGAVIGGRFFRRWWQKLTPEERLKYGKNFRRSRYIISGTLGALALGSFVFYETHLEETPFTKRKRFVMLTDEQFNEMSKYELEMMLELYKDRIIPATMTVPAYRRVVYVAQRLLKSNQDVSQIHDKNWTITVVDDDGQSNAFVLPCGSIFVFSGLLKLCDLDDELGVILGHEMAHAVMGHGSEKASFLHFMDMLMVLPLAALWAFLPSDATAAFGHWVTSTINSVLMELPHSRFIEHEADEVGLVLAAKACFDIRVAPVLWEKMALTHLEMPIEWLSTHPSHDKRQAQLEELIPQTLAVRDKCHCPRLPYFDPAKRIADYKKVLKQKERTHEGLTIPVRIA